MGQGGEWITKASKNRPVQTSGGAPKGGLKDLHQRTSGLRDTALNKVGGGPGGATSHFGGQPNQPWSSWEFFCGKWGLQDRRRQDPWVFEKKAFQQGLLPERRPAQNTDGKERGDFTPPTSGGAPVCVLETRD